MNEKPMNEYPLLDEKDGIPLFYPHVPHGAKDEVIETLSGRWIGQGPKVDEFERKIKEKFLGGHSALAVGSGTDALHLSYLLAGIKSGDEVIVPSFTCTATNIPLLYIGAKPVFADIDSKTMNICVKDIESKITEKTKAIACVDYGGVPCDYNELNRICSEYNLKLISDAAHSMGTKYKNTYSAQLADYTIFSFQAIKTLTTGDGGLVAIKNDNELELAKRLRWFGIDRTAKQGGIWENDIVDIGYKYQMNDIAAGIGLAGMREIDKVLDQRNKLFKCYEKNLRQNGLRLIGKSETEEYYNSAWLITIVVERDRIGLMRKLREYGIESAQVHYRNDRYSIFGGRRSDLPNMDEIEDKYLVLPLHTRMSDEHVYKICEVINSGW
jgi:dTDP-4-amino-4,6-dideoxygalactose transaminase